MSDSKHSNKWLESNYANTVRNAGNGGRGGKHAPSLLFFKRGGGKGGKGALSICKLAYFSVGTRMQGAVWALFFICTIRLSILSIYFVKSMIPRKAWCVRIIWECSWEFNNRVLLRMSSIPCKIAKDIAWLLINTHKCSRSHQKRLSIIGKTAFWKRSALALLSFKTNI